MTENRHDDDGGDGAATPDVPNAGMPGGGTPHASEVPPAPPHDAAARLLVVGVDGGGSKTRVLVADGLGATLAEAEGPASAVRGPVGVAHAVDVIDAVVRSALHKAGVADRRPDLLVAGSAGAGRERERVALLAALAERGVAADVRVTTDAAIALDDAFGEGPGVLLIAGTGSIAYGRGADGTLDRCGGWGAVIGDEGGGAWIGRRALNVAAAAADGREPATALLRALLTAVEGDDPTAFVGWAAGATPADFATLAPVVVRVAADGDPRANSLLALAVEELVLHVRTLARRLFVDERAAVPVALAGGLLTRGGQLRKRLEHRLRTAVPGAQLHARDVDPARGAVWSALRSLGA